MIWFFFVTSLLLAFTGLTAWIWVEFFWTSVPKVLSSSQIKIMLSLLKCISGIMLVIAKFSGTADHILSVTAAVLAFFALLFWEITALRADLRREADRDAVTFDLTIAKETVFSGMKLIGALGQLVAYKRQRVLGTIRQIKQAGVPRARLSLFRSGLSPDLQTLLILQSLALFLRELLPRVVESDEQNFRIGLYMEDRGVMRPVKSWDHLKKDEQFLQSYNESVDHFRINCSDRPACAVRCLKEGLLIVGFCESGLIYYHERQKNYLKSLIAYPIGDYLNQDGEKVAASLVVDTNVAGHFKEEDRETIKSYMGQFALLLELEAATVSLFYLGGSSSGTKQDKPKKSGHS